MPELIIWAKYGNGEKSQEAKYTVTDLTEATRTLRKDLRRTSDPLWADEVMERWNTHPGYCTMVDQNITWHFQYKEAS